MPVSLTMRNYFAHNKYVASVGHKRIPNCGGALPSPVLPPERFAFCRDYNQSTSPYFAPVPRLTRNSHFKRSRLSIAPIITKIRSFYHKKNCHHRIASIRRFRLQELENWVEHLFPSKAIKSVTALPDRHLFPV